MNSLFHKIRRLAGRALIRRVKYVNSVRFFQIRSEGGEPLDNIEHIEPFGFTSHPLPDAEAVVLAFNGNGSHSVAIVAGDQRYRLAIEAGECAIYNMNGDKIHIKRDRTIRVEAATKVIIDTPSVEMTGKLTVAESIAAGSWITSDSYMTAAGTVKGLSFTNTAGSGTMSSDGTMNIRLLTATDDLKIASLSIKGHFHYDAEGRAVGEPQ